MWVAGGILSEFYSQFLSCLIFRRDKSVLTKGSCLSIGSSAATLSFGVRILGQVPLLSLQKSE